MALIRKTVNGTTYEISVEAFCQIVDEGIGRYEWRGRVGIHKDYQYRLQDYKVEEIRDAQGNELSPMDVPFDIDEEVWEQQEEVEEQCA